ncbi:crotonase/enoyl-CoA hydratase family protein [Sphingobium sp. Sx8-8]|uniref:crotonase/enoyl-CoA hydratase family protein n=1 Tax=Sphingobium sp. Sx8-8 TaxID=2933617 RepID=UPI001F5ABEE4|nr:crotonase/enoyl-CoA hydratase family protein [Sphingobium sp. Sx8-8]
MGERVTISVEDGLADVRFNRPDRLNALDVEQYEAIAAMIARIGADPTIRAVVLSGEGRAFCSGVDLGRLGRDPRLERLSPRTHGIANLSQQCAWGWRTLPQPVIAAVHGFAFGAGFQIMLGADVRIVAPDTRLSLMEARWGLAPDVAGIALMRGLVREDHAREIAFTAREFRGAEAVQLGAATRLADDPLAEAFAVARQMLRNSPDALRAAKRLLNLPADADTATILQAESVEQDALLASANHHETLAAHREKRTPRFTDPMA